jgi:hypothetical protein|tara:strand:+ start:1166 stop:3058 length:1893 start_codon:yes stop_codon:yes gene_type:complete
MIDVTTLEENQQSRLIDNRWREGAELWSKMEKVYKKNKLLWQNNPPWIANHPPKKSKARDNRIFVAMESVISNLTGRPSKPNVLQAKKTPEAAIIAEDLQDFFLAKYKTLGMKKKMRRALRYLFFSRMLVMKTYWDTEIDDFNQKPVNPLKVRFNPKANNINETNYFIEEIETPVLNLIEKFPEQEEFIVSVTGGNKDELTVNNPKILYREAWIGYYVLYQFRNKILKVEPHPYWDWDGIRMIENEREKLEATDGRQRRVIASQIKEHQKFRSQEKAQKEFNYESYAFNHLDKPLPPYIFGSILNEQDQPVGETSLIEQAESLQLAIDERKRQFSDNAEMMNGIIKVDTNLTQISKADAIKAKATPGGLWYGPGVSNGVTREVGKELPGFLKDDMIHSTVEVDNLFGTQPTFRGEGGKTETATGRAILREQSFQRMNEMMDLVDDIHEQSYNWWLQFIKVRYTESHFMKSLGIKKAQEVIDLMQDDINEGVEVRVIPGQILPEDRLFKAEKAREDAKAGILDPLSYFELADYDDPQKQVKRLVMFKVNPFSILEMTEEDLAKIQQHKELIPTEEGGKAGENNKKAEQVSAVRQEAEKLINSPSFKNMPADKKKAAIKQIQGRLKKVIEAK